MSQSWRQDPVTENQLRRLRSEGLSCHQGMTKGDASDLIGTTEDASDHEIEVMKFFKVARPGSKNQTVARQIIERLFANGFIHTVRGH